MSGADTDPQVSRRGFLGTCGTIGATAMLPTPTVGQAAREQFDPLAAGPDLDLSGVSPEGRERVAAVDRRFQQQRSGMRTVHAVKNLGLDASGNTAVGDALASKISGMSNVRVKFPSDGLFSFSGGTVLRPAGPVDLIGNGCTFRLDTDRERRILNIDSFPSGSLMQGINIETTGDTTAGIRVGTEGTSRVENVNVKGYMRSDQKYKNRLSAVFAPVAYSSSATMQLRNCTAVGGSPAGTHDQNDKPESAIVNQIASPMGVWIGTQTEGTIQLAVMKLRGWSNGVYGGRTNGRAEVAGGTYWNNINSQLRLGGASVVDGATLILDDRKWSMKQNPGPYSLGEKQGVYAVRVDPGTSGNQTDPIRFQNVKIQAKSMGEGASVIDFESHAGPGMFDNCKIMNHLDRPILYGAPPAGGGPTNIMVKHCRIGGSSPKPVMDIHGRQQSRIATTCITIPNAGPDDIKGADIGKGVSFGKCKSSSGLKAPKKVSSGGNISSLPAPSYNGSASGSASTGASATSGSGGGGLGWAGKLLGGMVAAPLIGIAVMALPLIIGLLVLGGVTFGGLLLFFKKLAE
jgi:hypothetical protein